MADTKAQEAAPRSIPAYEGQLSSFHRAFTPELEALLAALPLAEGMRAIDLACGDGFYSTRLARRLGPRGLVAAVDINLGYLGKAKRAARKASPDAAPIVFVAGAFDHLPFPDDSLDFIFCAQSLYSLPEPVAALRHMARALKPGGLVAVLENDSMHTALLPWPAALEVPLRAAELESFRATSLHASKFYVGRRLPETLAQAGFIPEQMATHAFDRAAPLGAAERELLQEYLEGVQARVHPFLESGLREELRALIDPRSPAHLPAQPHFSMGWLSMLALGRKP